MRITVVTPSLDQAAFIERTIDSVLSQRGAFDLEYLVVDGGSSDGTVEILRRHEGRLRFVSERDRGQSHAINKGFRMATGEVLAWLNSDDLYLPGALDAAVRALGPGGAAWCFGQCRIIDGEDHVIRRAISAHKTRISRRYSLRRLLARNFIPQPATFFRRDLLDRAGPVDESLRYAMDYDLWLRFARLAEPVFVPADLAAFRWHRGSITGGGYRRGAREAFEIARRRAGPGERGAVALHWALHLAQVGVYGLLDIGAAVSRRRAP